jgi:hypothetical protein
MDITLYFMIGLGIGLGLILSLVIGLGKELNLDRDATKIAGGFVYLLFLGVSLGRIWYYTIKLFEIIGPDFLVFLASSLGTITLIVVGLQYMNMLDVALKNREG